MVIQRHSSVPENQHLEVMVEVVEAGPVSSAPSASNEENRSASAGRIFHIHS